MGFRDVGDLAQPPVVPIIFQALNLLVPIVIIEDGTVQTDPAIEQLGFRARFIGPDNLGSERRGGRGVIGGEAA